MSESYFYYVCVPAATDVLIITGDPIYGVWGSDRKDIPLQKVGLYSYFADAAEEARILSMNSPYFVEVVSIEFRAGSFFSTLEDCPRPDPALYYLGKRYETKE